VAVLVTPVLKNHPVISTWLLIVSFMVFKQLSFIQNKDLGFDTSNVMVIQNIRSVDQQGDFLRQELLKLPQVQHVSYSYSLPADNSVTIQSLHSENNEKDLYAHAFMGDEHMIEALGFRLLEGRNFDGRASDTASVILNESAVKSLELENPVGTLLNDGNYRVIGVVSDFNFESMEKSIQPAALYMKEGGDLLSLKFTGSNPQDLIKTGEKLWTTLNAEKEFDYYFLDENFSRLVEKEKILSKSLLLFNLLAMVISCLGLYGLSAFVVERKVKEIGIRRVLGASVMNITTLLSRGFAKPILLAFFLAVPIAFYVIDEWLSNYAYRVEVDPWLFLMAGVLALAIGLITVSWQTLRTALRKPVDSLRDE
jgi:putative ABC transport system permease protein